MGLGLILGGLIGYFTTDLMFELTKSTYDRSFLDAKLKDYFGTHTVNDALTDEVLIVAYSYNA